MRFSFLGSGSSGNAYVVEHGATTILVDCGFTRRDMHRRLARLMLSPSEITAVLITHEHSDHTKGLKHFMPGAISIYMTHGTAKKMQWQNKFSTIRAEESFVVGGLHITPIAVPHDAAEPVQFVFDDGARQLGVFTDLGHVTDAVRRRVEGLDALGVECNYCPNLLANNRRYPQKLKARISGRYGHLENSEAATLVHAADSDKLQHVVAVHLSEHNNTSFLARQALSVACDETKISIATQLHGVDWLAI